MGRRLKVKYYVESDPAAMAFRAAQYLAEMIREAVADRGRASLAISGGSTPQAAFRLLADPVLCSRLRMPLDKLDIFWVDERCVPPDHADSNYRMAREAWLDHVPMQPCQIHRIQGELDPQAAADRYEEDLKRTFRLLDDEIPRFDLIALGMGNDGHTASLFPYTGAIHEMKRLVVANQVSQRDAWRITLTWPVINHASSAFFLVSGADKAEVIRDVLTGSHDPERLPSQLIWPASGILTLILDKDAAAFLPTPDGDGGGVLERER